MSGKKKENYLDYVPKHNALFPYEENAAGRIEILRNNTGLFNRAAQLLLKKPTVSRIELDDFGTFVWKQIDGKRDVYRIGKLLQNKFGREAEPLYERLTEFLHILRSNRFILYMDKRSK